MADQDSSQDGQSTTLFHDLGQHLAHAYQSFLDSKAEYGQSQQPQSLESINQGQLPAQANAQAPVQGSGAQPISLTPQEMAQLSPQERQQVSQSQQPVQQPQTPPQALTQTTQPPPQQPDASQGSGGMPGPLKAQSNLANAAQEASQGIQSKYDEGLKQQQDLMAQTKVHFDANNLQDQQLMNAYMSKQIDPNHVINSMSTGSKVMTSLGLLFSGIGSGLTGQKNLALEMINNSIARDLEAQKSNLSQAYNAYQMHREGTKDQFSADLQYQKDNMLAIDAAIEQQKAKLMGPQAVANATATQLGLKNQILDLNQKQAMWNTMQQQLRNPSSNPANKIRLMQLTGQLNPNQSEQAFKELDRVNNFSVQKQNIMENFDKANQENTIMGRVAHLGSTPASVDAIKNQIMPYLKDAEGRINETEIKRVDSLIPSPGDAPHKVAEKRKALQDFMDEKASSSMLRGIGIQPQSQQAMKQPQTKTVNGVKYIRGPNGEAVRVQ